MILRALLGLFLAALVVGPARAACSAKGYDLAGFVHPQLKTLPSNAQGALFLPAPVPEPMYVSQDGLLTLHERTPSALGPANFRIDSNQKPRMPAVVLSWPHIVRRPAPQGARHFRFRDGSDKEHFRRQPGDASLQDIVNDGKLVDITAEVERADALLRVGVAGGFTPGAAYVISYQSDEPLWGGVREVHISIDAKPLDTSARIALVADGLPKRRLAQIAADEYRRGQVAVVQDFQFVAPASMARYSDALVVISEVALAPGTGYLRNDQQQSLCGVRNFGRAPLDDGRDFFKAGCINKLGRMAIRGRAGLLEVDDEPKLTNTIEADFAAPRGTACTGLGILKQAYDSGDSQWFAHTLCSVDTEAPPRRRPRAAADRALPSVASLANYAAAADDTYRRCAAAALTRMLAERRAPSRAVMAALVTIYQRELGAQGAFPSEWALHELERTVQRVRGERGFHPGMLQVRQRLLRPLLPAIEQFQRRQVTSSEKRILVMFVRAMRLPARQQRVVLKKLGNVTVDPRTILSFHPG